MKITTLLTILLITTVLTGCVAVSDMLKTASESEIALRAAVAEEVQGEPARAQDIIDAANEIEARLDGNPNVTVKEFYAGAEEIVNTYMTSPGLRVVAMSYFRKAEARILERIETGAIPDDEVLYVRNIIEIARNQAEHELARAQ